MSKLIAEIRRKFGKQLRTGRRHIVVTLWVLGDLARLLRWRLLSIGLFGLAAVGCKFLAAGILYLFVDSLTVQDDAKAVVPFIDIEFDLHDLFIAGVILGTILMMMATAIQFSIRRVAVVSAALFEERCVRRILAAATRIPHPSVRLNGEMVTRKQIIPLLGGARSCNLISRQAVQLMPSLISLLSALIVLIVIDPMLTFVLLLSFLCIVIVQYPMTNRSVRASDFSEIDRRAAMSDMHGFVTRLNGVASDIGHDHGTLDRLFGRGSAFQKDINTFTRRIDGMILGDLTARLGNQLILAGLFVFVGTQILSGERDWASFAAFVAIARMSMKDFQITGKILGQFGRLFMPVNRYMHFINAAAQAPLQKTSSQAIPLTLHTRDGEFTTVDLVPQQTFQAIISNCAGGEFSEIFASTTGEFPPTLIDESLLDPSVSMRMNLALETDVEEATLEHFANAFVSPSERLSWQPGWLDLPVTALPTQDNWLIGALKVAAAEIHGRPGIAIQVNHLRTLPVSWLEACRKQLTAGPVIIIAPRPQQLLNIGETMVVVAEDSRLAWWVSLEDTDLLLKDIEARFQDKNAKEQVSDDSMMMI